jgi:hypothetical protein
VVTVQRSFYGSYLGQNIVRTSLAVLGDPWVSLCEILTQSFQQRAKAHHKHACEKKRVRYSETMDNFMGGGKEDDPGCGGWKKLGAWLNVIADLIRLNGRSSDKIIPNQPIFSRPPSYRGVLKELELCKICCWGMVV